MSAGNNHFSVGMHVTMAARWQSCDMQAGLLQLSPGLAVQDPPALGLLDSLLRSSTASCIDTLTSHLKSNWSPLVLRSCPSGRKLRSLSESSVIVLSVSPATWKAGV